MAMVDIGLDDANFKWMAGQLGCEPEMVTAFSKVECKRPPFDPDGFPAILFERHVFYRNLPSSMRAQVAGDHPDLCARTGYGPGGYGTYGAQRGKFSRAFAIHADAAMEACSWGAFQELGENWHDYGFEDVGAFVDEMKNGLLGQCKIFIESIRHRGLADEMRSRDFQTLARLYNGAGYRQFGYDRQIEGQYDLAKRRRVAWATLPAAAPAGKAPRPTEHFLDPQPAPAAPVAPGQDQDQDNPEPPEGGPANPEPASQVAKADPEQRVAVVRARPPGFFSMVGTKVASAVTGNAFFLWLQEKASDVLNLNLPREFWVGLSILVGIGSAVWLVHVLFEAREKSRKDKELELLLVKENSTPTNTAQVIHPDDAELYKLKGYKVITS